MNKLKLYTDGACSGNPGPGGYSFAIISDENVIYSDCGFYELTTNNEMELLAVKNGLLYILENFKDINEVHIFTDSSYTLDSMKTWSHNWKKNNWTKSKGKKLENKEIIIDLYNLCYNQSLSIHWQKVKAHQKPGTKFYDPFNDYVDKLATGKSKPKNTKE